MIKLLHKIKLVQLLCFFNTLDAFTTWIALKAPDAVELNPLMNFVIQNFGMRYFMLLKLGVSIFGFFISHKIASVVSTKLLYFVNFVYFCVVVWNIFEICTY